MVEYTYATDTANANVCDRRVHIQYFEAMDKY